MSHRTDNRPGDDFNRNGDSWEEILTPHGWVSAGYNGKGVTYWRRPGKTTGISATCGHCRTEDGHEMLYVFTSSAAPLEHDTSYTKFAANAILNHDGDFSTAAADLAKRGFGKMGSCGKVSIAKQIVDMTTANDEIELFHDKERIAYITLPIDDHFETSPLDGSEFRRQLSSQFYALNGKVPSSSAFNDAIATLSGLAVFDGPEYKVDLRVAGGKNELFIDIGCRDWKAYRVTADGFSIVNNAPVKFRRSSGMQELPIATPRGDIHELKELVNVSDEQFPLLVGGLLSCMWPLGPYPCTLITGQQGTAKSTTARVIRKLVDPNMCPLRAEPKDVKALMVSAKSNRLIVADNLSKMPQTLSDAFCRLATGGGISDRTLYTNDEEYVIDAQRPVVITSITEVVTRGDLLDRSLALELQPINAEGRIPEAEYWELVDSKLPSIFSALLQGVSMAMKRLDGVELDSLPRMADFAKLVTAAEPAFDWPDGTFMRAYGANQEQAQLAVLESKVAQAVIDFVDEVESWSDSATRLHTELSQRLGDDAKGSDWPGSSSALSAELTRLAPGLTKAGVRFDRSRVGGKRLVELSRIPTVST